MKGVRLRIALDVASGPIQPGDMFLLCSDGLTGMMSDAEIESALNTKGVDAAEDLLAATLRRGAKDNVSFVLVHADDTPDDTLRSARRPFLS